MIMVYVAVVIVVIAAADLGDLRRGAGADFDLFVVALIINQGTNFLLGKISFVSNSVTSILQLALSIDYAIIFCNRFKEEHRLLPIRGGRDHGPGQVHPEIGSSCLTTVGGLVAMLFMQFKLGPDMAICLIKAIAFALLSAFLVMPGLLMLFGPLIEKNRPPEFRAENSLRGPYRLCHPPWVPVVFVVLIVFAFQLPRSAPTLTDGYSILSTPKLNDTQIAEQMIEDNFGSSNMVALVVPAGDFDKEREMLAEIESHEEVDYTMGLTNIEAMDGYMLADS